MAGNFGRENAFQSEYLSCLRSFGAYAVSVIGTVYASGQPDIDCNSVNGQNTKVELKVFRALHVPTRANILSLLKGPQTNVITNQMWRRNVNCIIIAQIGAVPDDCCIVSKQNFTVAKWRDTCKVIAQLKWGEYTPYQ